MVMSDFRPEVEIWPSRSERDLSAAKTLRVRNGYVDRVRI